MNPKCIEALKEYLVFVRKNSPYFRSAWQTVWPENSPFPGLTALPITDHTTYWAANDTLNNSLLTAPHDAGIVFKSGGTTGNPKFSFFSNEDWREFCRAFSIGIRRGGIQPGERIANLFYGGQLYTSLFFFGRYLEEAGIGVHFPLAGSAPHEEIIQTLIQFRIQTLAGTPTTMLNLLPFLAEKGRAVIDLKRIIFAGEAMFPDQIATIKKSFPECRVQSAGVAGVDYGELGWCDESCEPGVHYVFEKSTVLEILDDNQQPIEEPGVVGAIHVTNFKRLLMPVVRYPVGDMGMWLDSEPGKPRRFKLLGRTEKGARVGPMTLYFEDFQTVLAREACDTNFVSFQLIIDHFDHLDQCTLRIAVPDPKSVPASLNQKIISALYAERHMFPDLLKDRLVHPLVVEWVTPPAMLTNPRTGKLLRVLDRRHQA